MHKKIIMKILALIVCIFLCGCTRREQLVLEGVSTERSGDLQGAQEQNESETPGLQISQEQGESGQRAEEQSIPEDDGKPQTIFVHVCGAVVSPDVYELPAGSRVYEAVQAAGGFTEDADSNYVNQAQILSDGVKLVIPTLEETAAMMSDGEGETLIGITKAQDGLVSDDGMGAEQNAATDGKININTASEAELCNIPGIGAVRAAAIVAYRQEKGSFSSIEDIMNVSGIKEGTYEKIKDSIKVN